MLPTQAWSQTHTWHATIPIGGKVIYIYGNQRASRNVQVFGHGNIHVPYLTCLPRKYLTMISQLWRGLGCQGAHSD